MRDTFDSNQFGTVQGYLAHKKPPPPLRVAVEAVKRFRGGLVFEAHRLCLSLNSRLEGNKEEDSTWMRNTFDSNQFGTVSRVSGFGIRFYGSSYLGVDWRHADPLQSQRPLIYLDRPPQSEGLKTVDLVLT